MIHSKKILLADTSATILEVLTFAFETIGNKIQIAESKDKLIEHINKNRYDLIIIDIDLFKEETIEQIKAYTKKHQTQIFILSENSDTQTKITAKENGITGWIVKPFIPEKLAKTIISYLN